jgi:phage shock protein A
MTEQEREMDLQIAEFLSEIKHLKKVEQAAQAVVKSFSTSIDYNTWDSALDALEAVLKEKP